jgi:23S rRNA pseudouridine1911/1915/1917 synthase
MKMGGIQTIDVRLDAAYAGWRLDRALAAAVPTLSRERLKALIRSGAVEASGKAVRDPATNVLLFPSRRRRATRRKTSP